MAIIDDIESAFEGLRGSSRLRSAFAGWQRRHEALGAFSDVEEMLAFCRDPEPRDLDKRDAVVAAVCEEARTGQQVAQHAVVWLFLPGLLRLAQEVDPSRVLEPEDLWGELVAGFWEGVSRVRPGSRVKGHLLNSARWRARKVIREASEYQSRREDLSDSAEVQGMLEPAIGELGDVLSEVVAAGVITQREADLIRLTRLEGFSLGALARRRNVSKDSLRLRLLRAEARLLSWLHGDAPSARRTVKTRARGRQGSTRHAGAGVAGRGESDEDGTDERKGEQPSSPAPPSGPPRANDVAQ